MPLALASDWPVVPLRPLESVFAAVHRRPPNATEAHALDERLTWEHALRAHTLNAARAGGVEFEVGSIRWVQDLVGSGAVPSMIAE